MTGDASRVNNSYYLVSSNSYDSVHSEADKEQVKKSKFSIGYEKLSQTAQKTVKSIKNFVKLNFSQEKWSKVSQSITDSSSQIKEKFSALKAKLSPGLQQLSQTAQEKAQSLQQFFSKENALALVGQVKDQMNSLSAKASPGYEYLKNAGQKTTSSIHHLLFYKDDLAASQPAAFRLFFKGALQTLNMTLSSKISKLDTSALQEASATKKVQVAARQLSLKILFGVASRLLILVATPFQIIRDIALMPASIVKALQAAHLEKKITLIKASHQAEKKTPALKTVAKIYTTVSLTALKNIGLILLAPLRVALIGSILVITGVKGLAQTRDNVTKTLVKNLSNLANPKGITKQESNDNQIELGRLKKSRSLKNASIGQSRKPVE
jgi:hypothetical protein